MCFQCENPELTYREYLDRVIVPLVRLNGWAVQGVTGRRPFSYTVGLTECGLPELIVTGMQDGPAATLLHDVARRVLREELVVGRCLELPAGLQLAVVRVLRPEEHLLSAVGLYGDEVRALQLVWPDERGHYPWDDRYRSPRYGQPLLGTAARRSA